MGKTFSELQFVIWGKWSPILYQKYFFSYETPIKSHYSMHAKKKCTKLIFAWACNIHKSIFMIFWRFFHNFSIGESNFAWIFTREIWKFGRMTLNYQNQNLSMETQPFPSLIFYFIETTCKPKPIKNAFPSSFPTNLKFIDWI